MDIRCENCNKLLMKYLENIEVACPRCKAVQVIITEDLDKHTTADYSREEPTYNA